MSGKIGDILFERLFCLYRNEFIYINASKVPELYRFV